ncbi:hypothetical protein AJOOGB_AJOOGB_08760, partial [Dysosmobacter welbionis]
AAAAVWQTTSTASRRSGPRTRAVTGTPARRTAARLRRTSRPTASAKTTPPVRPAATSVPSPASMTSEPISATMNSTGRNAESPAA